MYEEEETTFALAQRLIKQIVRAFFPAPAVLVVDRLLELKRANVAQLAGQEISVRVANAALTELRKAHVVLMTENEDADVGGGGGGFQRNVDDAFLFSIDIKHCIDHFNLRVHMLREKLEEAIHAPRESFFLCTACKKKHDMVSVARVAAEADQRLCSSCEQPLKLVQPHRRVQKFKSMLEHYHKALAPLLDSLRKTKDLVLNTSNSSDALHLFRMEEAIRMSEGRSGAVSSQPGRGRFGEDSGGGGMLGMRIGDELTMDMRQRKRAHQEAIPWLERGSQAFHHEQSIGALGDKAAAGSRGLGMAVGMDGDEEEDEKGRTRRHGDLEEGEGEGEEAESGDRSPSRKRPHVYRNNPRFQEYLAKVQAPGQQQQRSSMVVKMEPGYLSLSEPAAPPPPAPPPSTTTAAPPVVVKREDEGEEEEDDDFEEVEV